MPTRPPIICRCGQLNCKLHIKSIEANERDKWRKRRANNPFIKLYSCARWRVMRLRLLAAHPVCQACNTALANEVDHIVNARVWCAAGHDFYDESNMQVLCASCHATKTAREEHSST